MTALVPVITNAGRAAVFAASNDGLQATISHLAFGSAAYAPTGGEAVLVSEVARIPVAAGERLGDYSIRISALLDDSPAGWIRECGIILSDGTLFAIYSNPASGLFYKSDGVPLKVVFDLIVETLPPGSLTVVAGDIDLTLSFAEAFAQLGAAITDTMRHQLSQADEIAELRRQVASLNYRAF